MGVVISLNPRAPPQHGTDPLGIPGTSSEREWSVSWSLRVGYYHPSKCKLPVKPGAGNGTKQTNSSSVPGILTLNLFPTILVLNDLGVVAEGGVMIWQHHSGHLSCSECYLLFTCSPTYSGESGRGWAREMAENWRPQGRLARHPSMRSRDWKLSCCNYRLWNRCGTH